MVDGCGISCWHPKFLRKFANTRWFLVVYGLLGTVQGTSFLYFVVTLTTIEKRFKIPSQTTGIILSGNEISQIMLSLILTYFGGQQNRPRWIAWGVVFSALSCFILAWPHYIYGAGEEALQYTKEYTQNQNISSILQSKPIDFTNNKLCTNSSRRFGECDENGEVFSYVPLVLIFMSQFVLGIGNTLYYSLGQSYLDDNTKQRNTPLMLGYAFSMRMFGPMLGFGLSYFVLNIYIDPRYTPIITRDDPRWLGAYWLGWNILGALMFVFAGLVGLFPKNLPKKKKVVENGTDGEKFEFAEKHEPAEKVELKNFPTALMRLLKNKLLIFNNMSAIFYILGSSGYITFMGRVMEVQFNVSAHGGSILTGPATILGMTIGLLSSGYFITKYKPAPKYLFLWNALIGLLSVSSQVLYTQIGCDGDNSLVVNGSVISCNANCNCDFISYSPVCDQSAGITYFSPCHAGCKTFDKEANVYRDCTCTTPIIPEIELFGTEVVNDRAFNKRSTSTASFLTNELVTESKAKEFRPTEKQLTLYDVYDDEMKLNKAPHDSVETIDPNDLYDVSYDESQESGETEDLVKRNRRQLQPDRIITPKSCAGNCKFDYYLFSFVSMISSLIGSTGRIGNVLLNFRAVEKRDKSFSQGLSLFLVSLFALIPGPIIFGRIIDNTCLVWNYKCGRQGDCQLYNPIDFRIYLHTASAIFILMAVFFDLLVWHYGKSLELYGDDEPKKTKIEKENEKEESPESQPLNK